MSISVEIQKLRGSRSDVNFLVRGIPLPLSRMHEQDIRGRLNVISARSVDFHLIDHVSVLVVTMSIVEGSEVIWSEVIRRDVEEVLSVRLQKKGGLKLVA